MLNAYRISELKELIQCLEVHDGNILTIISAQRTEEQAMLTKMQLGLRVASAGAGASFDKRGQWGTPQLELRINGYFNKRERELVQEQFATCCVILMVVTCFGSRNNR